MACNIVAVSWGWTRTDCFNFAALPTMPYHLPPLKPNLGTICQNTCPVGCFPYTFIYHNCLVHVEIWFGVPWNYRTKIPQAVWCLSLIGLGRGQVHPEKGKTAQGLPLLDKVNLAFLTYFRHKLRETMLPKCKVEPPTKSVQKKKKKNNTAKKTSGFSSNM